MTGRTKSPEGAGKAHEKMKPVWLHFFLRFSQRAVAGRHGRGFVRPHHIAGAKVCVETPFNASFAARSNPSHLSATFSRAPKQAARTPRAAPNFHPQKSLNHAQFVKIAKKITKFCQKKVEKCRKIFAKKNILSYNKNRVVAFTGGVNLATSAIKHSDKMCHREANEE